MQTPSQKWDQLYSQPDSPWKGDPLQAVQDHIAALAVGETADLGAGDGRDSLFIASHGGKVAAFDISAEGLRRLIEDAGQIGVADRVRTAVADLTSFVADASYQNVVSSFTLHFLTRAEGGRLVREMQSMTEPGGLNIIADFSSPFPGQEERDSFYPGPTGMAALYEGWEVVSLTERERKTRQRDENGDQYIKMAFELTVRKA